MINSIMKLTEIDNKLATGATSFSSQVGIKPNPGLVSKAFNLVSNGAALPANLSEVLSPYIQSLQLILTDPQLRQQFTRLVRTAQAKQAAQAKSKNQPS